MVLKKFKDNRGESRVSILNELQSDSPIKDLRIVCEDKIVTSYQALFSWMSSFLRRFFLSKRIMEDSGKLKEELTVILPEVSSDTLNYVIKIFTFGEAMIQNEKTSREISDLWKLLGIDRIDFGCLAFTEQQKTKEDHKIEASQKELAPEVIDLIDDDDEVYNVNGVNDASFVKMESTLGDKNRTKEVEEGNLSEDEKGQHLNNSRITESRDRLKNQQKEKETNSNEADVPIPKTSRKTTKAKAKSLDVKNCRLSRSLNSTEVVEKKSEA